MRRRRICVVTGSRADYGLLRYPTKAIAAADDLELQVAVTGSHLEAEFGRTVSEIESDGFLISGAVDIQLASDTPVGIARSIGLGVAGFGELFDRLNPDLVMVLGDRFEILAAASAALVAGLPMAHLCGGDVTEGSYDDAIRHSLTKMAHLHFVTNAEAQRRVIQLGELPERVHLVGSPGLDAIRRLEPVPRPKIAAELGIDADRQWLLVTFHPATRDPRPAAQQQAALLEALEHFTERGFAIVATQANADNDGRVLSRQFDEWAVSRADRVRHVGSLGSKRYLSLLGETAAVIGNSSSGLYEAPSFGTPAVNIGTRQEGRPRAASVIDCEPEAEAIVAAIERALQLDCSEVVNPFGDGYASERIVAVIRAVPDFHQLLVKSFHEVKAG